MNLIANGIRIEADDTGGDQRPVVLLIMGLGMQLIGWPELFVRGLVDAGFRVIRHDNRDVGLSEAFDAAGKGNLVWQSIRHRFGLPVRSAYTLQDMANDSIGVLDALGVQQAHVVGASMGGMIAQRVAATVPQRVLSLVSIMSSSGARGLPGPRPEVLGALIKRPRGTSEAELVAFSLGFMKRIASPAYPQSDAWQSARIATGLRRAYRPHGTVRQMIAIGADSDRDRVLARITAPTLVIHGEDDRLVPIACGQDTARRIAGARFIGVPGMGHDLPPQVERLLLRHMVPFMQGANPMAQAA